MIAKRILTPMGGSGYQRLSGYVLNVRQEHREGDRPGELDPARRLHPRHPARGREGRMGAGHQLRP